MSSDGGVPPAADGPPAGASRTVVLLTLAAIAGACTMGVEIAAVRILAPWFGASLVVWTNVLEVILLGLALGYLIGARASAGERPLQRLAAALTCGALFTAWLPSLAGPVCGAFLPDRVALHDAAPLLLWGSLAAALTLFLLPATLLGAVGPLVVEELQRAEGLHAGTAGGRVLAASTGGSLVGALLTTHVLVPHPALGLERTFGLFGICLAGCAATAWALARRRGSGVGPALPLAALAALPAPFAARLETPAPDPALRLLAVRESPYQRVRVVEEREGERGLRYLQVNEGFDSFQSAWSPRRGLLGEGFYYDDFVLPAWWARASGDFRVLVLGLGAGTVHRVLSGALPAGARLRMVGVELDPDVVELGRAHFELAEAEDLEILTGVDGRVALRALGGGFHCVVLDAYANQVEIPPHLCTGELFAEVREALAEGGWLAANVGGFGFDDPVVEGVAQSAAWAFESDVLLLRVPGARNYTLFARRGAPVPLPGTPEWDVPAPVGPALLAPREVPGGWRVVAPPQAPPLSDDRNGIELLQYRSLSEGKERLRRGA